MNEVSTSIKKYWLMWLFVLITILVVKVMLFWNAPTESSFWLIVVYGSLSWLGIGFIHANKVIGLLKYIKENYREKFEYLSSLFGFSPVRNDFKVMRFIYSKDDLNDEKIKIMKSICKKLEVESLIIFITFPFIAIFLFL